MNSSSGSVSKQLQMQSTGAVADGSHSLRRRGGDAIVRATIWRLINPQMTCMRQKAVN